MHDWMLQLYNFLPAAARSVPASLRGLFLRSWRYGRETERLVAEALDREHWSPERWRIWQEERLAYVLHRAATRVPYYRELWSQRRCHGDRASWEYLENWPILEKEKLRENPTSFVADDRDIRRMFYEHTSGTTGKPLALWQSRDTVRAWYSLVEARIRHWHGVSRHDRWAILGAQLVTPVIQRKPPFWVWNSALNQLYMSSYHLAPDLISHYYDALKHYRINYVFGYTSSLYALAQEALLLKRTDLKMTVVLTNAEPIFDYQRQTIAEAFQCPVRAAYGMAEIVAAASECQPRCLHLWPEVGWVEVVNGDLPLACGLTGDFVCTGLLNADMPLIRYRVGDRGAMPIENNSCSCGRTLPMLAAVEGRIDDVLYTRDGRRISLMVLMFRSQLPIREAQIIQETLERVRVRYVPLPHFTPEAARAIVERLQARMGAVEVILEQVDEVPRMANGKFRAVICNLPPEQKRVSISSMSA